MAPRRKPAEPRAPRRTPTAPRAAWLAAQTVPVAVLSSTRPAMGGGVARAGRRAALTMAGTGLLWVLATWAGGAWGWPQRLRALLDLAALAGFGLALWMTWQVWRAGRADHTTDAE